MLYTIQLGSKKKVMVGGVEKELFDGSFLGADGTVVTATIWKTDKDGGIFPNFDGLAPNVQLEANPWTSPAGKTSLYAPKKPVAKSYSAPRVNKQEQIEKAQEHKAELIGKAQDRKEDAIAFWKSLDLAVELTKSPIYKEGEYGLDSADEFINKWAKKFQKMWREYDAQDTTDKNNAF